MTAPFAFEIFAAAYFVAIAALSPLTGGGRRSARIGAAAVVLAGTIVGVARIFSPDARVWVAHGYLVAGYWLPALLVSRPPGSFEAWLRRTEPDWSMRGPGTRARGLRELAEFAYLCCYPLVPAAFLAVYVNGSIADANRFWTAVLAAGFVCYVSLPWLVSRPPRMVEEAFADASHVRHMNLRVLTRFSHGWNTFPSGHVAVAVAAALSVLVVAPPIGVAFVILAMGIAIGSVAGRYHYTLDAIAGIVVGVAAWALAALFTA